MRATIVLGPPGTGKTTDLLNTIEQKLGAGSKPNRIGFISFAKKAADEGKGRASERFGINPDSLPHFKTIHAMAFRHLGIRRDRVVGWNHLKELGKMLGMEFKGKEVNEDDVYGMATADRMLFFEGLARNLKKPLKQVWNEAAEDSVDWFELERFSRAYSKYKESRGLVDFTDMLEGFCKARPSSLPKFDALAVDEAQDLSPLAWDAVELLAQSADNVYVGGDDCQAIYGWSGADVGRFIGLEGVQKTLDQSYRIPLTVHRLADSISDRITRKRPRSWKARDELGAINWYSAVQEVDMSKGTWLLLARNGYMLEELEEYCMAQGWSFHSVNRDPLKSRSLVAIRIWENLRRGGDESSEQVLEMLKYMDPRLVANRLMLRLKADDSARMNNLGELAADGLGTSDIWHRVLTKISPKERDFFIAARKNNEALLKEPRIKISTIHASKGGQADHVLLLTDMSYRCYSNMEQDPEDEMRVWYVAATRCKQTLNLVMPRSDLFFEL